MPKIVEEKYFNGAEERVKRLGLTGTLQEVREILRDFSLTVKEEKDANGGAAVRELIDARFTNAVGWTKTQAGDIDWRKCEGQGEASVCLGVEIQTSARSDLLIMDVVHLRDALEAGDIDLGVLVVPSDKLSRYLTDRGPNFSAAMRHIKQLRADYLSLLVIAIEHDGPGSALEKRKKR